MAEDSNSRIDKIKTLAFIEDYHTYRVLWAHKHKDYTHKSKRNDALVSLSQKYYYDIRTVKNKIKSLRSYFAKEHQKVITKRSEPGTEDFESSWFAYKSLSFILDSARETIDSGGCTAENLSSTTSQDENNESQAPRLENDHEFTQRLRKKRNAYKSRVEREEEAYNTMKTESEKMSQNENTQPLKGTRKKRNVHKPSVDETEEEGAENITKTAREKIRNKDECDAIGRLIACKLRKLTPRNRLLAERRINDILFNLELEEIDSTHKIYSVDPLNGLSPATSSQSVSTEEENTSNANPLHNTDGQSMLNNNQPFLELKVETQDEHEN